jgi:hypothetical protein
VPLRADQVQHGLGQRIQEREEVEEVTADRCLRPIMVRFGPACLFQEAMQVRGDPREQCLADCPGFLCQYSQVGRRQVQAFGIPEYA